VDGGSWFMYSEHWLILNVKELTIIFGLELLFRKTCGLPQPLFSGPPPYFVHYTRFCRFFK